MALRECARGEHNTLVSFACVYFHLNTSATEERERERTRERVCVCETQSVLESVCLCERESDTRSHLFHLPMFTLIEHLFH